MNKITTDFVGTETRAEVKTRLQAILDYWLGPGSTAGVSTWGDIRTLLNSVATPNYQIADGEVASSFRTKLNVLNTPDQLIASFFEQAGSQGWFYDPNDLTTMFQDSAGITPADFGLSVGLMLDKSKGLVLGPELVTNGTFDVDANWTKGTGWTISGGAANTVQPNNLQNIAQSGTFPVATYRVQFTVTNYVAGGLSARFTGGGADSTPTVSANGTYTFLVTTTAPRVQFDILTSGGSGATATIDNISVRELPGNHRSQTVSNARTILGRHPVGGIRNLLGATATLATQTRAVAAVQHTLSFRGTGTVTLSGASTSGPLVGTGANNIVSLTFTPTAGSLTLTVSGTVNDAQLERGAARSNYQLVADASGFNITEAGVPSINYLAYNGTSTSLSTSAFAWGTDKATVVAGVRKLSDAGAGVAIEFGTSSVVNGTFGVFAPANAGTNYGFAVRGTVNGASGIYSGYPAPESSVLSARFDTAGTGTGDNAQLRARRNGANLLPFVSNTTAGNIGTHQAFFGARGGTSLYFNGREYPSFAINRLLTANELTQLERFTAQRTGVVI